MEPVPVTFESLISSSSVWAYDIEYSDIGLGSIQNQSQYDNFPWDNADVLDRNGFKSNSLSLNENHKDEVNKVDWLSIGIIAWVEVLIAAYAHESGEDPNRSGGIGLLIAPLVFQEEGSLAQNLLYTAFVGYNLSIDEDDYSESEVARNNFLLLNIILGMDRFFKGADDNGKHSFIGIRPTNDGMLFIKNYRFD